METNSKEAVQDPLQPFSGRHEGPGQKVRAKYHHVEISQIHI